MNITARQLELLHHTLGVRPDSRRPYRNHFVAGPGHHDQHDLDTLESMGFLSRGSTPAFCEQGDVVFYCTDRGRNYAVDHLPQPPKLSRYDEYLRSECSEGFAWWLGFEAPTIESYERHYSPFDFSSSTPKDWVRMRSPRAIGEFCRTKKDAKASYKLALKKQKELQRALRNPSLEPV